MSCFDLLVGQDEVVERLRAAVRAASAGAAAGSEMSHAWLFTGPPGSGRSVAARAFAAALLCPDGGCGHCHECRTALAGTHADVELVAPTGLSYSVAETRELVARAALAPVRGRWQIAIVEDADRFTEQALNALLKALEEPPPHGVWLLCAPSVEDLLPTVRSRCRLVPLRVPSDRAIAARLVEEGVEPEEALLAARAAQGHVGRARRLATDDEAAGRRRAVLDIPGQLTSVGACFAAAERLVTAAKSEAAAVSEALDDDEMVALRAALGDVGGRGNPRPRGAAGAIAELERRQRSRATRAQRDSLDRALVDLAAFYRDVLVSQFDAPVELINPDLAGTIDDLAAISSPETTLRRIEAVLAAREAIDANVAPLLAVEAMTVSLNSA